MEFRAENGARFAYMTKYIVTPVRNNFDKWPICDYSLRSYHKFEF